MCLLDMLTYCKLRQRRRVTYIDTKTCAYMCDLLANVLPDSPRFTHPSLSFIANKNGHTKGATTAKLHQLGSVGLGRWSCRLSLCSVSCIVSSFIMCPFSLSLNSAPGIIGESEQINGKLRPRRCSTGTWDVPINNASFFPESVASYLERTHTASLQIRPEE